MRATQSGAPPHQTVTEHPVQAIHSVRTRTASPYGGLKLGAPGSRSVDLPSGIDWLIFIGSTAFSVALVPQLARTLRLGRADDLSIPFVVLVIAASGITLIYWLIRGENWEVYFGFLANLLVWGVVLWYRLFPRPGSLGHENDAPHRPLREP